MMRLLSNSVTLTALALFLPACDALRPLPAAEGRTKVVETAIFEGGYGIGWHLRMAEEFNAAHAADGIEIALWGDPRTADIIKPRLLRGDPPDLILDERLPLWLLIARDKLIPFNEALELPAPGGSGPWREDFAPGMLDMFTSDGKVYAVPAAYGAWACWYDAAQFEDHGWKVPKTWREFLDLCEEIEKAGIAPLAFQGKYPSFYGWNTYISLVQRIGGLAAINRINLLEPGAFSHPDAVQAAGLMQALSTDHFQRGSMAMTHTESQLQFVNGLAAMIFCGIWLENEMKDSTPPGFQMRSFTVPAVQGGRGNPAVFHGQGMEFLFVPKDARYPDEAFAFARFLVSPAKAEDMGRSIGVISPLANATPRDAVSPALQSVLDIIDASDGLFNVRIRMLLPEWTGQVMNAAIAGLLRGDITPKEYGRLLDEGVTAARNNPDIIVPPYVPYDPAKYGEPQ